MLLALIALAAFALRLSLTLSWDGYLGVDGGAYLLSRNAVLGDEPTSAAFPRPPLAPGWLLVPFTSWLGDDAGYKVWQSAFSLLPLIPCYLLTRRFASHNAAITACLFLSVDPFQAMLLVNGAVPLMGFTLIGLAVWATFKLWEGWSWQAVITLILSIGLTPWVHQSSAALLIMLLPVALVALMWHNRKAAAVGAEKEGQQWRRLAPPYLLGGAIAFTALPWYLGSLPGVSSFRYPGPLIYFVSLGDYAIFFAGLALPLAWVLYRTGETPQHRVFGWLIFATHIITLFLSYDEPILNIFYRARHLLALWLYPGIAWVLWRYWASIGDKFMKMGLAMSFASLFILHIWIFYDQARTSQMVSPATAHALEYLEATNPEARIATNAMGTSYWIAALNQVPSPSLFTARPPEAFQQADADLRCLLGWVTDCQPVEAYRRLGVEYILIDERFPWHHRQTARNYGAPEHQWEVTARTPWLQRVFRQSQTVVYEVAYAKAF